MQHFKNGTDSDKSKQLILQKPYSSARKLKKDVKEVLNKYSKFLSEHYCALKEKNNVIKISADINEYWFEAEIKINKSKVLIDYETNAPSVIEKMAITSVKQYFVLQ
jgi:hypothetical protein